MIRGFYTAASGALTQQKTLNVVANNISNISTVGFKSQNTVTTSFYDHIVSRMSNLNKGDLLQPIGPGTFLSVTLGEYTNYGQGAFENTDIPTNVAINGKGYFMIETEKYGNVLTRNGQFSISDDGFLVLEGLGRVLSEDGEPIELTVSDITIDRNGMIHDSEGEELAKIFVGTVEENTELRKVGEDFFVTKDGSDFIVQAEDQYDVIQGKIEKSNVGLSEQLTKMIEAQRSFQSCTQVLKMYDQVNDQSIVLGSIT
ncbi:MAG: flagellar hook-basal body protein [Clostridia bacterium]|nr:flagellar hook-basal body protein [Clostridia bacterium]